MAFVVKKEGEGAVCGREGVKKQKGDDERSRDCLRKGRNKEKICCRDVFCSHSNKSQS